MGVPPHAALDAPTGAEQASRGVRCPFRCACTRTA